jgi:lipoate-protein ligase A
MMLCRLIVDPPQDGAWNMAVDEALLEDAAGGGQATLRFYQWSEPTLSLGYFQAYGERHAHAASRTAAAVRRLSGGGALLHDRELTYSLSLPATHALARRSSELYAAVHAALIEALAALGDGAHPHGDGTPRGEPADERREPFLCFLRRSDPDVVMAGGASRPPAKVLGSAQRRRRGAVLQHGSVLLDSSPRAPELPGIAQLTGIAIQAGVLIGPWSARLAPSLARELRPAELEPSLREIAQQLQHERYGNPRWTERR